ncbi:hypothetical protein [Mycobacterium avium]|nr:hypothetical protein [Mycobacterium avium]ETA97486.1 hypothetical protein O982_12625 [Mycobacterium avium 10-5581]ATO63299.2 hypothetical protein BEP52_14080 [Mycobacterium avium subsp. hominissuis]ATO67841.2 hypothetical protein BJP78_13900 [Mycobacterium avium subsp. hominissuis]ATO72027.2 hypothetical protein BJP74_11765 [Mycobacterium avium subsp. hominissuis]MCA4735102.1 hypothetical protein [Mycobacterium avium subsp. hominissuis]
MRIAAMIAASVLVAGCAHTTGGRSEPTPSGAATPSGSAAGPSGSKPPGPSAAPAAGAAMSDVIAWIEAGHPADPSRYHTATRDGVATPLGDDIAVSALAGKVSCMTDAKHTGGAVVCLVSLTHPAPPPATAYGQWQGGWVDFDGTSLQVGSARADPGPFVNGNGTELANGDSLAFGEYRCRADQAGLYCVNYAHQSAAKLSPAGVEPFGCLRSTPPPDGVGAAFTC